MLQDGRAAQLVLEETAAPPVGTAVLRAAVLWGLAQLQLSRKQVQMWGLLHAEEQYWVW